MKGIRKQDFFLRPKTVKYSGEPIERMEKKPEKLWAGKRGNAGNHIYSRFFGRGAKPMEKLNEKKDH